MSGFQCIGVIGRETPQKLRDLIARYPVSVTIYLDSPGGDLFAGVELGRVIRKAKLNTNVGETAQTDPKYPGNDTHPATDLAKTNLWR